MHLCIAGSVRAMPEKEKPPAMPVDIYSIVYRLIKQWTAADRCGPLLFAVLIIFVLRAILKIYYKQKTGELYGSTNR